MPTQNQNPSVLTFLSFGSQQLPTSPTVIAQAGRGITVSIQKVLFCNTTATAQTVNLYVVVSGGSAGPSNQIWNQVTIPGFAAGVKSTIECYDAEGLVLPPGASLYASANASGAITAIVSGLSATV